MREILFRGRRIDNGEWAYGYVLIDNAPCALKSAGKCKCAHDGSCAVIYAWNDDLHEYEELEVDPSTIGQYTGEKDVNGKRIFEGDIVKKTTVTECPLLAEEQSKVCTMIGAVTWRKRAGWVVCAKGRKKLLDTMSCILDGSFEVISNIHDNPELLDSAGA